MAEIWNTVHQERSALSHALADLPSEAWNMPSLCAVWSVHDVLAHLVHHAKTTKASFVLDLIRARFNFDRANQTGVERERRETPAETLIATACSWTTGHGLVVRGTGLDMLLALTGRAAGLDGLTGDGVETLSGRM